jgi:TetR/AcrR family transcriptional regulator
MVGRDTRETILILAAGQFAALGYAAVSMRDISGAVGVAPAALYHHFPNKSALYTATLEHVFEERVSPLKAIMERSDSAKRRLGLVIEWFARLVAEDEVFTRLLHRELMDGDEARLQFLVEKVFRQPFGDLVALISELAPHKNAFMAALSVISLVVGHLEFSSITLFLPGARTDYCAPELIARHAMDIALNGLTGTPTSGDAEHA